MARDEPSRFGALVRRYRVAAGLSQEALAARVSVRGLSDLERGVRRVPRYDTVQLLTSALGLSALERAVFEDTARGLDERASSPSPESAAEGSNGRGPAAAHPGGHTRPLVGRAPEVALVEHHLGAAAGAPPVLLFAGEPGIGKSRLLREAQARAAQRGWTVVHGGCHRPGGQELYAPLVEALERHVRAQFPAQLRAQLRSCAWLVKLLPELAEGPIEPLPAWTLSSEQERRLTFRAVGRFLANMAGLAGTLLLLDDLQWAEAEG